MARCCALAALALLLAVGCCEACTITGVQVGQNQVAAMTTPTKADDGTYARYSAKQVEMHFTQQTATLVPVLNTTFSCVDARADTPILGTPGAHGGGCRLMSRPCSALHVCAVSLYSHCLRAGGDIAEIIVAAMTYFKLTGAWCCVLRADKGAYTTLRRS